LLCPPPSHVAAGLQDPNDKRSIIPDEKLGTILTAPVTMFSMNKQISRHVLTKGACGVDACVDCRVLSRA
jgi:hypothetical protein